MVTAACQISLAEQLRQQSELYAEVERLQGKGRPFRYNMADFVAQFGTTCFPQELPKKYKKGKPRACFYNSMHLAVSQGLIYVEGYASAGILPILHGWCVDPDDHEMVIDVTTTGFSEYIGVRFTHDATVGFLQQAVKNDFWSVIDNYPERFPLLQLSEREIQALIWRPKRT